MYKRLRNILAILTISLIFFMSSCANKSYQHKYRTSYRSAAPSAYPASRKTTPIAKKYIVPSRRKAVLGQSGRFLK